MYSRTLTRGVGTGKKTDREWLRIMQEIDTDSKGRD